MRDITLEDTFTFDFTTRAFATGVPTTLAGTPVLSVHEEGNDTFITSGVSLDVDIGTSAVAGLHEGTVVATAANGYETGKSYSVFISTGTVGGVSVVGEVVHEFTIGLSAAAIDLANATDGLSALKTLLDAIPTTAMRGTDNTPTAVENRQEMDSNSVELAKIGTIPALDGAGQNIGAAIAKLADDNGGADFDATTDSLQAVRDRGDSAWTTGAGGSDRLLMVDTTIATLASQTSFTLTAGSADNDAYNNCTIVIEDVSTSTQKAVGIVSDYIGASKTITLKYDPGIFTMATTDKVYILAENALKSTLANRQLNVAADGDIGGDVDGNVVGSVGSLTGHTNQTADHTAAIAAIPTAVQNREEMDSNSTKLSTILTDTEDMQPLIEKMAYVGSHGLGVWIDDGAANTNTVLGTDGTPDNPVSTIAAATTIATSLGSQRFYLVNDTQITLAQTYEGYEFIGVGVSNLITLGSQDVDNTLFRNVMLTGTQGGTQFMRAIDCQLQAILSGEILADDCWITGDITLRAATNHSFGNCKSGMPGNDTPDLTFPGSGTTSVNFRHYSGGLTVKSATSSDTMSYEADGQLIIDASCTSLTIVVRGNCSITDNGTTTSLTQDGAVNRTNINAEADTALTDYDPPTNAEMEARTPTAAQLLYITRHAATALPVTFADGGSTTQAILVNVDGAGASGTDDVYNGRVLVFNAGTLDEQVTDITDYDGGTKTATITAVTTSVVSSHTAVMV